MMNKISIMIAFIKSRIFNILQAFCSVIQKNLDIQTKVKW